MVLELAGCGTGSPATPGDKSDAGADAGSQCPAPSEFVPVAGNPRFSVSRGLKSEAFDLELSVAPGSPAGAEIAFTLDGSEPDATSSPYGEALHIDHSAVVRATSNAGRLLADLRQLGYYPSIDPPQIDPPASSAADGESITLGNPNSGGTLYYSLSGSDPREPENRRRRERCPHRRRWHSHRHARRRNALASPHPARRRVECSGHTRTRAALRLLAVTNLSSRSVPWSTG
jgi:hypothetical protein